MADDEKGEALAEFVEASGVSMPWHVRAMCGHLQRVIDTRKYPGAAVALGPATAFEAMGRELVHGRTLFGVPVRFAGEPAPPARRPKDPMRLRKRRKKGGRN